MRVHDTQRHAYVLADELRQGGEAVIYRVQGRAGTLAKIYKRPPAPDYERKIRWMTEHPPADPTRLLGHTSISWPSEALYNDGGHFIGFLMPQIQGAVEILDVLNPRRRTRTLPDFDWQYQHRAARNLASALAALHAGNYVVGDINEANILVTPTALISLIDTDSFQVTAGHSVFRCPVGKPEYTPPELQGQAYHTVVRRPEHDRFGLAVLIFQLLMEGSHPFRCRWAGQGDPPPVEARIAHGWFPYAERPAGPVAQPPQSAPLNVLSPPVAGLMRRCFIDGHQHPAQRPSPVEWERALRDAEGALVLCSNGHYYAGHLPGCPRCQWAFAGTQVPLPPVGSGMAGSAVACSACGQRNSPDDVYCRRCARQLGRSGQCPHCGNTIPVQAIYCPRCAQPLRPVPGPSVGPSAARVVCPKCGRSNNANEVYCQRCAQPLGGQATCLACYRAVPVHAAFCPKCGHRM